MIAHFSKVSFQAEFEDPMSSSENIATPQKLWREVGKSKDGNGFMYTVMTFFAICNENACYNN
jgi:hypothetical protein